jgi:membrane protease YdiL (CAAX protease family)
MGSDKARAAVLLYGLVTGLAFSLGFVCGNPDLFHHPDPWLVAPWWVATPLGTALGLALGLLVVWLSQRAVVVWRWTPALRLHNGLRHVLGVVDSPLREGEVVLIALSSACAEELFFRGWLVPVAGVALSSVLFGALHYAPGQRGMWVWIPTAVVMGALLALMFVATGNLAAPVVCHLVINYRNLHFINSYDPTVAMTPPVAPMDSPRS